jgi:hypothetical protein
VLGILIFLGFSKLGKFQKFQEKNGNIANFSSFQNLARIFPQQKALFHIDWNHISQLKVRPKIANKIKTLQARGI